MRNAHLISGRLPVQKALYPPGVGVGQVRIEGSEKAQCPGDSGSDRRQDVRSQRLGTAQADLIDVGILIGACVLIETEMIALVRQ